MEEVNEDFPGQTSGELGSGNWSLSAADLNKQTTDPNARAQMAKHQRTSASQLLGRIGQYLTSDALVGMTDAEISSFQNGIEQLIDAAVWKAKQKQTNNRDGSESETNANGIPKRTGTQVLNKI